MSHVSLVWSEAAIADLSRLHTFLVGKDVDAARAAIKTIRERVNILKTFPQLGKPALDLNPGDRELPVPFGASGYVIAYTLLDTKILILAVRHQKEAGYRKGW